MFLNVFLTFKLNVNLKRLDKENRVSLANFQLICQPPVDFILSGTNLKVVLGE